MLQTNLIHPIRAVSRMHGRTLTCSSSSGRSIYCSNRRRRRSVHKNLFFGLQNISHHHHGRRHGYDHYFDLSLSPSCLGRYTQSSEFSSTSTRTRTPKNASSQNNTPSSLSVAIVGTGPSGCYTAKYLIASLRKQQQQQQQEEQQQQQEQNLIKRVDIDMIDRLPTPFGLVRSGVAPDHPEVKNVENDFVKLFHANDPYENETNTDNDDDENDDDDDNESESSLQSTMSFRGNVNVGKDVSLKELRDMYDIVVLAYGCESDRKLNIEGEEELCCDMDGGGSGRGSGVYSAREFVAWYNGHPDFVHMGKDFQNTLSSSSNGDSTSSIANAKVVIIGQGNVALDCARILAKGSSNLMETDIATHALDVIKDGVRETTVLGRRGHVQGAFTIKELRELTKLNDVDFIVDEHELDKGATPSSIEELNGPGSRPKVRIDKLLRDAASKAPSHHDKKVKLRFMLNPVKFIADPNDSTRLGSVLCERTELQGDPGKQVAVGTGEMEEIPATMALVSIGYKGIKLPDMDSSIFDERRGVVKNVHGKVEGNLFVSGWLKRGPSGIIGTNIADAKDTVSSIVRNIATRKNNAQDDDHHSEIKDDKTIRGRQALDNLLSERNVSAVDWSGYERIDKAEKDPSRLRTQNQPREKITNVDAMLKEC